MKKVSIITLSLNSEKNILDCINSIKNQSYKNIEHIFIDGNSNDKTLEIIRKNCNENSVIISEDDNGIYDAWNKGFSKASGDIVGTVMSDDFLKHNDVIKNLVDKFERDECDIIYGNMDFLLENEIVRKWKAGNFKKYKYFFGWMAPPPTVYISKDVLENNSHFNNDYKIAGDYEFLLRLFFINNYKVKYIDEFIYTLRMGGISNQSIRNIIRSNIECYKAWKENNLSIFPFWILLKPFFKIFQILNFNKFLRFYFK